MFHATVNSNAVKMDFDAATVAIAMDKVRTELPQAELLDREASQRRWPAKAQEYWSTYPNTVGLIANGDDHVGCIYNRRSNGPRIAPAQRPGDPRGKGSGRGGAGRG